MNLSAFTTTTHLSLLLCFIIYIIVSYRQSSISLILFITIYGTQLKNVVNISVIEATHIYFTSTLSTWHVFALEFVHLLVSLQISVKSFHLNGFSKALMHAESNQWQICALIIGIELLCRTMSYMKTQMMHQWLTKLDINWFNVFIIS